MAGSTEYFLKILGADSPGQGGGSGGGNGQEKGNGGSLGKILGANAKAVKGQADKDQKGNKKSLGATLGIKFGMASLLKQSQVFTGFIGTIFQLMGALVDVILAPFLPILIPGIQLIARMIPYVAKYAQMVYDFIDRTVFQWFRNLPISDKIKDGVAAALSAILVGVVFLRFSGLWKPFASLVDTFFTRPLWLAAKTGFEFIGSIFNALGGKTVVNAVKGGITLAWDATGGKIVTRIGTALDSIILRIWTNGIKSAWDTALIKLMFFEDFMKAPFKRLWGAMQIGLRTEGDSVVKVLVRKLWTQGLKAMLVTPLMLRLTGIAGFLLSPFSSLWKAIATNVDEAGTTLISRTWAAFKNIPIVQRIGGIALDLTNYLTYLANWFTNLPFVTVIRNLPGTLADFWNRLPQLIGDLPVVGKLLQWLGKELLGKLGGLFKGGKALLGAVKGATTKVAGTALDVAAPKAATMLGALSPRMLLKAAQGFKAIPVLGAIAELGFGGWATYKDYKKYGAKAAMGRAALTLANTTTALFDPSGLASAAGSIGTNVAMDISYSKLLDPKDSWKRANPDIWVHELNTSTGDMQWNKVEEVKNGADAARSTGAPVDRFVMAE